MVNLVMDMSYNLAVFTWLVLKVICEALES